MASIEVKNFDSPDETRPFEGKGHADVLNNWRACGRQGRVRARLEVE